ncbi:MAG: lipid-A-disaccharide synthase [Bdellovibrionaceae bacterium]|nr:lipid-A-disaccharide synthase [Pseudobdellovibrionaceae bacterium]
MMEIMFVAAEASSSLFALRLMEFWKKQKRDYHFFGVGSPEMEALGFERLGKSEEMAVVGVSEIIDQYAHLKEVFNRLVAEAARRRPKLVVVMDYPEFNLMLSKRLHAMGIPVVYYVSPQVWAWRKGRVEQIKKYCRKVLLLFPFEREFYASKNVPFEFVGHPVLDELNDKYFTAEYRRSHRARCGVQENEIVIGLMPGSRRGEIKQHLQMQLEIARRLCLKYSNIRILLMVAPTRTKEELQDQLGDLKFPLMMQKDEPLEMIHLADFILAASGTATLQVALLEKPMVIMYKMKWLTGIVAKVLVRGVKFFGLPNLIAGREIVPERWQGGANVEDLFQLMCRYIDDPIYAQKVRDDLADLKKHLGDKGATARVAASLEEYLQ